MTLDKLEEKLKKSWSIDTASSSSQDEWTELNPAIGQCTVTALIVNDYFGGEIVWAEVQYPDGRKVSHYFNLIDGKEVDLTISQFPEGSIIPSGIRKNKGFETTREYALSNENTKKRYEILKSKLEKNV